MDQMSTPNHMTASYEGTLDNFTITLKTTETELSMQAENSFNSKTYSSKIALSDASSISNGLFHTIESFYQGLIDAIDKTETSATITMAKDGVLHYSINVAAGSQKIPFKFSIELTEEKISEEARLLRQIEKLTRKVVHQEKKIQALEQKLANKDKIPIEFNAACAQSTHFHVLNSGRTLMSKCGDTWRVMFARDPLPKFRKTSFSVRIDHVNEKYRNIMIGICPSSQMNNQYGYGYEGGFAYFGHGNGQIYKNGAPQKLSYFPGIAGTVIKIVVDFIMNEVAFYYDEVWIYASELNPILAQSYDYYPFVDLFSNCDKVSFVGFEVEP